MRITGGKYRGRLVAFPKGSRPVRPAMERMRISIFSILGELNGRSFLDLFAGSGIMALEAASRGAFPVVCVEVDRWKFGVLKENLAIAEEPIRCRQMPTEHYIKKNDVPFSIVYCDPPFNYNFRGEIIRNLARSPSLKGGGYLLMHYPSEDVPLWEEEYYDFGSDRAYGRSHVLFLKKK